MQKTADNSLVIDAYNANPTSMAAALDNFRLMKTDHKMCILGDMKELGDASAEEHTKVVETLSKSDFERIWLVGEEFRKAAEANPSLLANTSLSLFPTVEEVKAEIAANKPKGYTILIKGSNSTKLIQTVELL
jgi:UDP-N-acetylmuramoyl-tripeptide--D-alanyl-D-alanine ligase